MGNRGLNKFDKLKAFESEQEFDRLINYCATLIFSNDETSEESILSEILKILFVKIFEEDNMIENKKWKNRFTITQWNNYKVNIDVNGNIIKDKLFPEMRQKFRKENIFEGERINLREETVNAIVGILQNYSIKKTDIDVKGRVFESLLSKQFKGSRGQYFTPKDIVEFINEVSQPRPHEKVIDPCCGSGRFIIDAYHRIWGQIEERYEGDNNEITKQLKQLREEFLWSVDIDPRLVRIAKMNMIMHDDGSTNIYKLNSLKSEFFEKIEEGSFELIMTNPPFGGRVIDEISPKYEIKFKKGQRSQTEFIKVFHRLLSDGGRVCTVIDDGILNTKNMKKLREYILNRFVIRGVFSLPRATFSQYNQVKSSILFMEKKKADVDYGDYSIFMSISNIPEMTVDKEMEKLDLDIITKNFFKFKIDGIKDFGTNSVCFSIKKSDIEREKRFDPYHFHPIHGKVLEKLKVSKFWRVLLEVADEVEQGKIEIDDEKEYNIISSIESTHGEIITDIVIGSDLPKGISRKFRRGDIIISRINAKIGCVGILIEKDIVLATNEYYAFRLKNDNDIGRYLQLQLRTIESIMQIRKDATGQYIRISDCDFKKIVIIIPEPSKQKELSKPIEEKINKLEKLEKEIQQKILYLNKEMLN